MLDFENFEDVFGNLTPFPFDRPWAQQVEASRKSLDGRLFFDRVLAALNLSQASANYPPKNEQALRQLHRQVCDAPNVTVHHKLSILYYLLVAIDEHQLAIALASNTTRSSKTSKTETSRRAATPSLADGFAERASVPRTYHIFMKGLWHMDSLDFKQALVHLTHPCLQVAEFADDIVTVLARSDRNPELALSYYYTVNPILRTSVALELLFGVLCRSDVGEALRFSRVRPGPVREQLFRLLVLSVLDHKDSDKPKDMSRRALELTSLPFDAEEERWFADFLQGPDAKHLSGAKDTLLIRRMANGNVGSVSEQGSWAGVLEGFKAGSGGRAV